MKKKDRRAIYALRAAIEELSLEVKHLARPAPPNYYVVPDYQPAQPVYVPTVINDATNVCGKPTTTNA